MVDLNTLSDAESLEKRVNELTEENALLFDQLHVVQEELEKYYSKLKECEQRTGIASRDVVIFSPRAMDSLMENLKLRVLVEQQRLALDVESRNSLPARLGEMFIRGAAGAGSILALPGRLRKVWKALDRKDPPVELGGKTFQKVLDAYAAGGNDAVEKLLDTVFISHVMRANAYTALARHLMLADVRKAAVVARQAWECDPRPYRLKWLAFRLHDADDAVTAEALLDMLPTDIPMSDSEKRQAARIRQDSKQSRKWAAEKEAGGKGQGILAAQSSHISAERDRLRQQAEELQKQITCHEEAASAAQKELDEQRTQARELERLAESRNEEVARLGKRAEELKVHAEALTQELHSLRTKMSALETLLDERQEEIARSTRQHEDLYKLYAESIKSVIERQQALAAAISAQGEALTQGFATQTAEVWRAQSAVQSSCKQEIDKALQQSVAYTGLRDYFASGELPTVTPWKRGWPASPDFMLWLIELIDKNDYDLILEFGSGITTLYTAKTLAALARRDAERKLACTVSFDHQEQFAQQTHSLLTHEGLDAFAEVVCAPLHDYTAPSGTVYPYYSCEERLAALSGKYKSASSRILVTVDGPPGATGKHARYPAFPLVMQHFAPAKIDFLLDDYCRGDETELAGMWQAACAAAGISCTVAERSCEKGALLLQVSPT